MCPTAKLSSNVDTVNLSGLSNRDTSRKKSLRTRRSLSNTANLSSNVDTVNQIRSSMRLSDKLNLEIKDLKTQLNKIRDRNDVLERALTYMHKLNNNLIRDNHFKDDTIKIFKNFVKRIDLDLRNQNI